MLRSFVIRATQSQNECACSGDLRFKRESIRNAPLQSPNSHLLARKFFLLNKICDGVSSKAPFLKAATLSIVISAYPRVTKTNNGNFKLRPFRRVRLLTRDEHAHSFCRCVARIDTAAK